MYRIGGSALELDISECDLPTIRMVNEMFIESGNGEYKCSVFGTLEREIGETVSRHNSYCTNEHKYCVSVSRPKEKHYGLRDKIDFKKTILNGKFLGVLNFNLMIPIEDAQNHRELDVYYIYVSDGSFFFAIVYSINSFYTFSPNVI